MPELRRQASLNKKQTRVFKEPWAIIELMRSIVPKEGDDYQKAIMVVVRYGDAIPEHVHPEHTVLLYVEPAGVPIVIEGVEYLPQEGELLYLPPNTPHSVPKNTGDAERISIAMLVEDGN